jgi:hypothetical protein
MKEALVGGRVSSIVVPLVEMTHTCAKVWMSGGAPWYVPRKDGSLKILGPISMSGYASRLVWTKGRMLSMLDEGLGS